MRLFAPLLFLLGLSGCEEPSQLPPMLQDQGKRVGTSWDLCDANAKQEPAEAVHHKGIVERLNRKFPVGSPAIILESELVEQGFAVEVCPTDRAIRIATYRWKKGWGGQGLIAFKANEDGRLVWSTGYNIYRGP